MAELIHPDRCERIFHAALKAGDLEGVHAALTVMAAQDPDRAQGLLDALQAGLVVASRAAPPPVQGDEDGPDGVTVRGWVADHAEALERHGGLVSAAWVAMGLRHIAEHGCPGPGVLGRTCVHDGEQC